MLKQRLRCQVGIKCRLDIFEYDNRVSGGGPLGIMRLGWRLSHVIGQGLCSNGLTR
jgi:hypothetical protein